MPGNELNLAPFNLLEKRKEVMEWTTENNKLSKEFTFNNFREALSFVNQVGALAEGMDHHPDILLHSYKKVLITLTTHSKGKVTDLDHQLAAKIDAI